MSTNQNQEKSLLPLLAVIGAVVSPLLFILGLAFGVSFGSKDGLIGGSISDWLTATATVAVTALTFILAKESWQLRLLQVSQIRELQLESIRPNVSVYLEGSHIGMNFINVRVSNLGKGIARRVTFQFRDRAGVVIPHRKDTVADKFFKLAIFRRGVESVGVNQVISSYLFNFPQLNEELGGKVFEQYIGIQVTFQDANGTQYENDFSIDFAEFEGISELGGSPLQNISQEIKQIREQLGRTFGTSGGRFGVDLYDSDDRNAETAKALAYIEEQKAEAHLETQSNDVKQQV